MAGSYNLSSLKDCLRGQNLFNHMQRVATCGKISEIEQNKEDLKEYLSALLNSGGGVILFDCLRKYEDIIAKG